MSRRFRFLLMVALLAMGMACVSRATPVPLTFSPPVLPEATAGQPYRALIAVAGAETPIFEIGVTEGALPEGLSWHYQPGGSSLEISGVPAAAGSYPLIVTASCLGTSRNGQRAEQEYTLVVR